MRLKKSKSNLKKKKKKISSNEVGFEDDMLKFIHSNMPNSLSHTADYNMLSTIQSNDAEDKGTSGSDNDSGNDFCESEGNDFNGHEQDQIMEELLYALDPI